MLLSCHPKHSGQKMLLMRVPEKNFFWSQIYNLSLLNLVSTVNFLFFLLHHFLVVPVALTIFTHCTVAVLSKFSSAFYSLAICVLVIGNLEFSENLMLFQLAKSLKCSRWNSHVLQQLETQMTKSFKCKLSSQKLNKYIFQVKKAKETKKSLTIF